jgi:hypothetical protein
MWVDEGRRRPSHPITHQMSCCMPLPYRSSHHPNINFPSLLLIIITSYNQTSDLYACCWILCLLFPSILCW